MADDSEEWEEWRVQVRFEWTYITEGPWPADMAAEDRRVAAEDMFWDEAWDSFYQAYTAVHDINRRLQVLEVEPYD